MKLLHAAFAMLLAAPAAGADYDAAAKAAASMLGNLVALDTTNPPGNEARAAALGVQRLAEIGLKAHVTTFAPGRENLTARVKGSGKRKPLLLIAHTDVVGAKGQPWTMPPHRMTEKDGFYYGRGVRDDLGMAAIAMEVLILLHRDKTPLQRDVILAWTGDEESGGLGILGLLEKHRASIDAEWALNEGGGLLLDKDGKVNLVEIQVAEKIYQDFELRAVGPTGHSSVPVADNAIFRLARALERLSAYKEPARLIPVTRSYFAARADVEPPELAGAMRAVASAKGELPADSLAKLEADPSLSANLRTTCVPTMLSGGTRVNALPAEAKANVNCRILPDETVESVQARLARVIDDPQIEIRYEKDFGHAEASPADGPAAKAIEKTAAALWPGVRIVPFMSRGATDSRHLRAAGIQSYGVLPIPTTEEDARRMHGIDERIPVGSLRTGVEYLHKLVLELAAK